MWKFIGVLSFIGVPAFTVMAIVSFLRKTGKAKRFFAIAGVCFALFILAVAMDPTPPDNSAKVERNRPETQTTQQSVNRQEPPPSSARVTTAKSDRQSTENVQQLNENVQQLNINQQTPVPLVAAKVTKVVDGDTVYVKLPNGAEEKLRLIGVDTPESTTQHEPYGKEASDYTKSRLSGKTVFLEKDVSERDKYNRLLRYVWLDKPAEISDTEIRSKMFNAILLLEGYARLATYPPDVKYVDYFTSYQSEARSADKGLWGIKVTQTKPKPVPGKTIATDAFVGSAKSDKYHYPDCRSAKQIKPANLVTFSSAEKARDAGYVPCKVCSPP